GGAGAGGGGGGAPWRRVRCRCCRCGRDGSRPPRLDSARMFASWTTLLHLAISAFIRAPNSSGVLATGENPQRLEPFLDVWRCDGPGDVGAPALDDVLCRARGRNDAGQRVALEIGNAG